MVSLIAQLLGGFLGGSVFGEIVHVAEMGAFWYAVIGTLGGVAGGQLIGFILGKTEMSTGIDVVAVIGPFVDGALTGGIVQIFVGMYLRRLIERSITKRRRSYF